MPTRHRISGFLLSLLIGLFCLIATDGLETDNTSIPDCPSFDCGNGVKIVYPFWVSQSTPDFPPNSYCGYPDFGITCRKDKTPIFSTFTDSYTVQNIDNTTNSIFLTDADVLTSDCPRVRHGLNISKTPLLSYAPAVVNLTFFFNCKNPTLQGVSPIPCLQDTGGTSFVFNGAVDRSTYEKLNSTCKDMVVSPVLQTTVSDVVSLSTAFAKALKGGFQLQWTDSKMSNCMGCEDSGGRCGYRDQNGSGFEFVCFCNDGPYSGTCHDNKPPRTRSKILIGVGCSAFLALVAFSIFLWRKYRKNKGQNSFVFSSRTTSSYPSFEKDPEMGNSQLTHIFSYQELEEATNGFDSSKELGDGGFGTVYKGHLRDGRVVAVKRLYENNYKRVDQFKNEVVILSRLRHQNLVSLYGCTSRHSRELLLVYEYVCNGTVADHLHGSRTCEGVLTWPVRMNIAIETAGALAYLHAVEPQIIHRDVKTNNILLDECFHVKVADFGLSRLFPLDATHVSTAPQGTPGYLDPEYHQCYQLTDKSDVYSFGVVLVELISSKPAVDITRHRQEINLSNMAVNKIPNGLLHELVDPALGFDTDPEVRTRIELVAELTFRCLQADKDMRPTMEEVWDQLKIIANGDCREEKNGDADKLVKDDIYLLRHSSPNSPKTVTVPWVSRSTTPNSSA